MASIMAAAGRLEEDKAVAEDLIPVLLEIEKVKRPRDVESAILACQSECLRTKNLKDSAQVKDIIAEIVAERMQMKALDQDEGQSIAKNHQAES